MQFKIHLDNVERQVEAAADGAVVIDGETFQAKVTSSKDDRRVVQLGEKSYEVRIVENCVDEGVLTLELSGERIPVTINDVAKNVGRSATTAAPATAAPPPASAAHAEAPPSTSAAQGPPEDVKDGIWAPVPGKIVDVFVKAGDPVVEGSAVLILEAMKMENELHATKAGTVTGVYVKKGDQAERGQLLVAIG